MPALFLDDTLCWQPIVTCKARALDGGSKNIKRRLPTWSWAAWEGKLSYGRWDLFGTTGGLRNPPFRTVSTVQWHIRRKGSSVLEPIAEQRLMEQFRSNAQNSSITLPLGWERRHEGAAKPKSRRYSQVSSSGKQYFVHEAHLDLEFLHPIPVRDGSEEDSRLHIDPLLFCHTQSACLFLAERMKNCYGPEDCILMSLRDERGAWAGAIQLHAEIQGHEYNLESPSSQNTEIELVSISAGYTSERSPIYHMLADELELEERPKGPEGSNYEWYNVLWVEWEDGIAYRKASGRVEKNAWEALPMKNIDLVLG